MTIKEKIMSGSGIGEPFRGLHEECGVFGVWGVPRAAEITYYGLHSLQHRGQDSAGIAVSNGESIQMHKAMGTIAEVFKPEHLMGLAGHIACGHVRYATAGSASLENAQPILLQSRLGGVAVAHNGQLVN